MSFVLSLILAAAIPAAAEAIPSKGPAPSLSLVGITIGQPLAVPQCASETSRSGYASYKFAQYAQPLTECWKHDYSGPKPGQPLAAAERVRITLSRDVVPSGFLSKDIEVLVLAGLVEEITLLTPGVSSQDAAFSALSQKYGAPSTSEVVPVQNRMGANFEKLRAIWRFDEFHVVFQGMGSRIDRGWVSVSTPAADAFLAAEMEERRAKEPQL